MGGGEFRFVARGSCRAIQGLAEIAEVAMAERHHAEHLQTDAQVTYALGTSMVTRPSNFT